MAPLARHRARRSDWAGMVRTIGTAPIGRLRSRRRSFARRTSIVTDVAWSPPSVSRSVAFLVSNGATRFARSPLSFGSSKAGRWSRIGRQRSKRPGSGLQWSIDSIALQTYAKVGNVPYVLHDPNGVPELVIGVGRSDLYDPLQ